MLWRRLVGSVRNSFTVNPEKTENLSNKRSSEVQASSLGWRVHKAGNKGNSTDVRSNEYKPNRTSQGGRAIQNSRHTAACQQQQDESKQNLGAMSVLA